MKDLRDLKDLTIHDVQPISTGGQPLRLWPLLSHRPLLRRGPLLQVDGAAGHGFPFALLCISLAKVPLQTALEATQGQSHGFLSQLPHEWHLEEVASVAD